MQSKYRDTIKEKGVRKMLTIQLKADSMVFKDLTPSIKREIFDRCYQVARSNMTPFITDVNGKDVTVLADHSDLYGLMYSLSFKYDIELV